MTTTLADRPSLFSDRRFSQVWSVGCLTGIVRWLELLAFGLFALDVTGSPSLVALLALLRFLPLALFGIFIGAIADLIDARKLLIASLFGIIAVNLGMALLFFLDVAEYWHVAAATFLSGTFWSGDLPLRRRMLGEFVPFERLAEAMALDNATSNGTRMLGPLVGGFIYGTIGITGVFVLGAVLHSLSLVLVLMNEYVQHPPEAADGNIFMRPLRGAARAFQFTWQRRDVICIYAVTVVFNLFAFPFVAMIPVIGKEDLSLTATAIGLVATLEGTMAFIVALLIARFARNPYWYRKFYYYGVWMILFSLLFIGNVPGLIPLMIGIISAGSFAACFSSMQSTLVYSVSPQEMRGRLLGLMTIAIGTGLVGFANVGITAEYFGGANAVWIIAAEGIIPMLLIGWWWKELHT